VPKLISSDDEAAQLPSDSIPGGDFKYVCVGYSAWDEAQLRHAAKTRSGPGDPVRLPYCEGLEVVSAAAMNQQPGLLTTEGAGGDGASAPPEFPSSSDKRKPIGSRGGWDAGADAPDLNRFAERMDRMARRILDKAASNAAFMADAAKKAWQQLVKEASRGDKDR
jgi:hypothetical protein